MTCSHGFKQDGATVHTAQINWVVMHQMFPQ